MPETAQVTEPLRMRELDNGSVALPPRITLPAASLSDAVAQLGSARPRVGPAWYRMSSWSGLVVRSDRCRLRRAGWAGR